MKFIPYEGDRVETGTIGFGTDWPGLFIRGDDCLWYKVALENLLEENKDLTGFYKSVILELIEYLDNTNANKL